MMTSDMATATEATGSGAAPADTVIGLLTPVRSPVTVSCHTFGSR
jgi:hypothetical protein